MKGPLALLLLANALWGSSYVVAKIALQEIPPPLLAAWRFTLAALLLWTGLAIGRGMGHLPPPRDLVRLLALGAIGIGMNGLLGFWGVSLTTATDAALLIVGEVLFTTALAIVLIGERLTAWRVVSLVIGLVGVIVLVGGGVAAPASPNAPARVMGDLLILAGLAFESLYTVFGTHLTRRYHPFTVLTISVTGSCALWLPVIVGYTLRGAIPVPSAAAGAGVLYLAGVVSVLCYLIWFGVLRHAGAALGGLTLLAQPVVGAVLGILILGDQVTFTTLLGGSCVAMCLLLAAFSRPAVNRS